jgi:hypothetical protein
MRQHACVYVFESKQIKWKSISKSMNHASAQEKKGVIHQTTGVYLRILANQDCKSAKDSAGELQELRGQSERKILRLLCFQHRQLRRQLRLIMLRGSLSRTRVNYRQRSGARHQLAPECRKSYSRPTILSTSAMRRSQQTLGGSTTTSPPIVATILRQQLDYVYIVNHGADHVAPDKS